VVLNWIKLKFATTCFYGRVIRHKKFRCIRRILKLTGAGDGTRTRDTLLGRLAGLFPNADEIMKKIGETSDGLIYYGLKARIFGKTRLLQ